MLTRTIQAKPVLVSVYVERPKRRSSNTATSSTSNKVGHDHQHHHHHYHHHHYHYVDKSIKQDVNSRKHVEDEDGKGYSRRAQLLRYSQSLRQSAKLPPQATPLKANSVSSNHHQDSPNNVAVQRKPKHSRTRSTTCLGNWRIKFCRSLSSVEAKKEMKKKKNAMKGAKKNLQLQKWGFISKLLSTFGKNKVKYRG